MERTIGNRVILKDLPPGAFQHPLDREATDQLRRIRGFDMVVAKFLEYGFERLYYVYNIATSIRIGPQQLPTVYSMLRECCAVLDVPEPELYLVQGHEVNARTFGHTNPFIVLYTELLDVASDDELMAVIAHELGHIKCGHVLYKQMAYSTHFLAQKIAGFTLGISEVLFKPFEAALVIWDRRSELSADRAAMLAMQHPEPCLSMLMKLAGGSISHNSGLNLDAFVKQAYSYHEDMDTRMSDKFYRLLASIYKNSHPFTVERARALLDWLDTPEPERIFRGEYNILSGAVSHRSCPACGRPVSRSSKFCDNCNQPVRPF